MSDNEPNATEQEILLQQRIKELEADRQRQSQEIAELKSLVQAIQLRDEPAANMDIEEDAVLDQQNVNNGEQPNPRPRIHRQYNPRGLHYRRRRRQYQLAKRVGFDRLIHYLAYDKRF